MLQQYVWVLFRLLTVTCYGEYTAIQGPCKFNSTHISQCPSGYGSPRFYQALDAYSVQSNVSSRFIIGRRNSPFSSLLFHVAGLSFK